MATRFYLPASGSAPLGSLAVDSSWGRTEALERRPCDVVKSNTSLTQKSYMWAATASNDWVWLQFQSKPMTAAYDWTTADTVSMVIKVAESVAQVDSHLAYVVRVVSGDGATIRGIIGVYQATSTEYPTSLAAIATRIHDARVNGATNFSSQVGDRIIIEIGHWGVTPATGTVYQNFGDPSATQDFTLTAGDTNDYCPWVELSRDVSFTFSTSDSKPAFIKGKDTAVANTPAFIQGKLDAVDHAHAYILGSPAAQTASDSKPAFIKGKADALASTPAYIKGQNSAVENKPAYIKGKADALASIPAYVKGKADAVSSAPAYILGSSGISEAASSKPAFILGIDAGLLPDADISHSGTWLNELNTEVNLYDSINEFPIPVDADFIYCTDPTTGYYYECSLTNPSMTPEGDVVVLWRGRDKTGSGHVQAAVQFRQGSAVIASQSAVLTTIQTTHWLQLTPAEKASITDWTDLRIRIIITLI